VGVPISPGGVIPAGGTRPIYAQGQAGLAKRPSAPGYPPRGNSPVPPPYVPGYLQAPVPPQPRNTGLVIAIIVAVVLVAVCIGAAIAILQSAQQGNARSFGPPASVALEFG
jgi:hypothetical protein